MEAQHSAHRERNLRPNSPVTRKGDCLGELQRSCGVAWTGNARYCEKSGVSCIVPSNYKTNTIRVVPRRTVELFVPDVDEGFFVYMESVSLLTNFVEQAPRLQILQGGTNEKENPNQLYLLERRSSSLRLCSEQASAPPRIQTRNQTITGSSTRKQPFMRQE